MAESGWDEPTWRCVVTGIESDGTEIIRHDTPLVGETIGGMWRGSVLAVEGWPGSLDDGDHTDSATGTAPGSVMVAALAAVGSDEWVLGGFPNSEVALTAYLVITGRVVVELGDHEADLGPGEVFLPRDQPHRVRSANGDQARLIVARLTPDPAATPPQEIELRAVSGPATRVRRVVAGLDDRGLPAFVHDGDPALGFALGDESRPDVALTDIWELGGVPASNSQGGDAAEPFELEPRAFGAKVLNTELKPADPQPGKVEGWHTTATIDVDIIVDGAVDLFLPDGPAAHLGPGDIVVQRGTNHRWVATGDRQLRMLTIMIGVRSAATRSAGH